MSTNYDAEKYHRRSIRLKGYDYSKKGAYFVTICTRDREWLFGEIVGGEMVLNDVGKIVQTVWNEMPKYYTCTEIDKFVIMPNHVHGIIIVGAEAPVPALILGNHRGLPTGWSLSDVVHRFKSLTTTRYRHGVRQYGWQPFTGRLWQRNYYEHIVRNEDELNRIREYILDNPLQWQFDRENPRRIDDKAYDKQWGHLEEAIYGEAKK